MCLSFCAACIYLQVYLKLENLHPVGSFKLRGAANTLLSLSRDQLAEGVHTVSTGRAIFYIIVTIYGRNGALGIVLE